jgi:hypothetical protein
MNGQTRLALTHLHDHVDEINATDVSSERQIKRMPHSPLGKNLTSTAPRDEITGIAIQ